MTSFVIGVVLEPEVRNVNTKNGARRCASFGLLSGRVATSFDVWDDSRVFGKVCGLEDGETICAIVGDGVSKDGRLRHYLNDLAPAPDGLRNDLMSLFLATA